MVLYRKRDWDKAGIYIIKNIINGKFYIGKSSNIYKRMVSHQHGMRSKSKDENLHLIRAWHKYGESAFIYEILEYCEPNDELLSTLELKWMTELDAINKGYNMRLDTETKCIISNETRLRMSIIKKVLYADPNYDNFKHSHKYWQNHPEEKAAMAEKVSQSTTRYNIEQYTRDGILIAVWPSVRELCKCNDGYKWQNIYSVCGGYKPTAYGYKWKKVFKNQDIVRSSNENLS